MFYIFLCCCDLKDDEKRQISDMYEKLMPKLINYSQVRLIDPSYAEDVVQTAFIILMEKYDNLERDNINFWIYQVVDNLIKNQNRKEKSKKSKFVNIDIDELKNEECFCFEHVSYAKDILSRELSETESDFFNTYFVLCESHETAAKKYNISINASKARKCRIKTRVVLILKENGITPQGITSK